MYDNYYIKKKNNLINVCENLQDEGCSFGWDLLRAHEALGWGSQDDIKIKCKEKDDCF